MYHAYCCLNKQRNKQGKPSCPWQVRFKDVEPRLTDDGTEERMVEVYKLSPDHDHHPLCGLWVLEANAAHLAAKHRAIRRGPGTTHMVGMHLLSTTPKYLPHALPRCRGHTHLTELIPCMSSLARPPCCPSCLAPMRDYMHRCAPSCSRR